MDATLPTVYQISSCVLTSAANTFWDFCNALIVFPFFLFVLIIGVIDTVGWISNAGGGVFSLAGTTSMCVVGMCSFDTGTS